MTPLEHLVTLLLCTFAAWATISAIHRDRNDTGTTRIKLASRIAGPPLLLLILGAPFTTVILYYLAGFMLIYGLAFVVTAASYGLWNTLRAITNLNGADRQHLPPEPDPDEPVVDWFDDPATGPPDDDPPEPRIFKDQKKR